LVSFDYKNIQAIMSSFFSKSLKNLNHHAYCIIGSDSVRLKLRSVLESDHDISIQGNPDFFEHVHDIFTIDHARALKSLHEILPVNATGKRIFIIAPNDITTEAQNALLKLLEEPAHYAHFFLIVPSAHILLPTVISRLSFIDCQSENDPDSQSLAEKFLKLSLSQRLEFAKNMVDDITDKKRPKQDIVLFLNAVQAIIYREKGVKKGFEEMKSLELVRKYSTDRSPSLKMLLEYVALKV